MHHQTKITTKTTKVLIKLGLKLACLDDLDNQQVDMVGHEEQLPGEN